MRITRLLPVVLLILLVAAGVASASNVKLAWTVGWDAWFPVIGQQPLNYAHSFVRFNQPNLTSDLAITYHLQGAAPNATHSVGIHVFHQCPANFGQFPNNGHGCASQTRPIDGAGCLFPASCPDTNSVDLIEAVEFGTLTTDADGNGNLEVYVSGIAPGDYDIEFHVRLTTDLSGNGAADIYQSPGPFGSTVTITIP